MDNSSHLILYRRTTFSHFLAAKINLLKIEQNGATKWGQAPFGDIEWQKKTSQQLGLEQTFKPRGRPKKQF